MKDLVGWIIAEGLCEPTIINKFSVCKVEITEDNMPIDYDGNVGRWHCYKVKCSREEIDTLQCHILRGLYAFSGKATR